MDSSHMLHNGAAATFAAPTQSATCEAVPSISPLPPSVSTIHGQLPSSPGKYASSLSTASITWMSVVIVIAGALSIVGAELALGYYALYAEVGAGIWCGLMFVAAGAVGIAAGQHKTDTLVKATVANLVLAILFATVQLVLHSLGLKKIAASSGSGYSCNFICHPDYPTECKCESEDWEGIATVACGLLVASAGAVILFSGWLLMVVCLSVRTPSASSQMQMPTTVDLRIKTIRSTIRCLTSFTPPLPTIEDRTSTRMENT